MGKMLIESDYGLDASWLAIIQYSTDRVEVKQGLRYFLTHDHSNRETRRLLESAATRFSHDVEIARWVYENDPDNERTQSLLLNCLLMSRLLVSVLIFTGPVLSVSAAKWI